MSGGVSASGDRSVAAGGDIGWVHTGDLVTVLAAGAATGAGPSSGVELPTGVELPHGLTNIPFRTGVFVGRTRELDALDRASAESPGRTVVSAVHGLGGVGKSTLAAHWAATRAPERGVAWWITAESAAGVDSGLAGLAVALRPALARALPPEALKEAALRWLADHDDWVLVLDNVTDPADIGPLLSRVRRGRVLVTSRRAGPWHRSAHRVPLDVLSPAEAAELVTRVLRHGGRRDTDGVAELCAELDHLPLALEQAAAYCAQDGTAPRTFLDRLAAYPRDMLDATADEPGGPGGRRTVARVWCVTMDRLADDPLAGALLMVLAWFAPDGTPRSLLEEGLGERPPVVARALGRLAAHSMVSLREDGTVSVHRLVQAVSRTLDVYDPDLGAEHVDDALGVATALLVDEARRWAPQDPAHWPGWRRLLPHVEALAAHAPAGTDVIGTVELFNAASSFLTGQCRPREAVGLLSRAEESARRLLGERARFTLAVRSNLAVAHDEAGDHGLAMEMYDLLLRDLDAEVGMGDPETLNTLNNIACAERGAGHPERAIRLYDLALPRLVARLGPDHRRVLTLRNNRAFALWEAERAAEARARMEELYDDCRAALGEDDHTTLTALHNLGSFAVDELRGADAVPLLERAAGGRARVLGAEHPATLGSRGRLAVAFLLTGEPDRALALAAEASATALRNLGPDHPVTADLRVPRALSELAARRGAGPSSRVITP